MCVSSTASRGLAGHPSLKRVLHRQVLSPSVSSTSELSICGNHSAKSSWDDSKAKRDPMSAPACASAPAPFAPDCMSGSTSLSMPFGPAHVARNTSTLLMRRRATASWTLSGTSSGAVPSRPGETCRHCLDELSWTCSSLSKASAESKVLFHVLFSLEISVSVASKTYCVKVAPSIAVSGTATMHGQA